MTAQVSWFMYFWVISFAIPNNITLSMFLLLVFVQFCEYLSVPACAMKVATGATTTSVLHMYKHNDSS